MYPQVVQDFPGWTAEFIGRIVGPQPLHFEAPWPAFFYLHSSDQSQVWNKEFDTPMVDLVSTLQVVCVCFHDLRWRIIRNTRKLQRFFQLQMSSGSSWSFFFTFKNTTHPLHKLASGDSGRLSGSKWKCGICCFFSHGFSENRVNIPEEKIYVFHSSMICLVVQNPGNCEQKILTWGLNRIPNYQAKASLFTTTKWF